MGFPNSPNRLYRNDKKSESPKFKKTQKRPCVNPPQLEASKYDSEIESLLVKKQNDKVIKIN